jgi:hypothetical protein
MLIVRHSYATTMWWVGISDLVKRIADRVDRRVFRWLAAAIVLGFWALVYWAVAT